jgi:hypothetical protein
MEAMVSEEERLRIKCVHLEFMLTQEKANNSVRLANLEKERVIRLIFSKYFPEGNLEDYSFDIDTGAFSLVNPPVEENKEPTLVGAVN